MKIPHIVLATPFRFHNNPHLDGFNAFDKTNRKITLDRIEVYGLKVDQARNQLVVDFLERTEDKPNSWLCFVDDDVLCPTDTFDLFLEKLNENPTGKFFYGEYALKKRTYDSAHVYTPNGGVVTVATGLMWVHRSVFVSLLESRITHANVPSEQNPYRWFICEGDDNKAGEDHYFTQLCLKIGILPIKIDKLVGIHIDFVNRSAHGPSDLVRNGKIRYDKAWIYALEKTVPILNANRREALFLSEEVTGNSPSTYTMNKPQQIYNDVVEHKIEVDRSTFKETKAHTNIAICTPRRSKGTPVLTNLNLNPLRNTYNIDMYEIVEVPRDTARNQLVQKALDDGHEWVLFIDDDTVLHYDAISELMSYNEPIIGFNYSLKKPYYESAHLMEVPTELFNKVKQFPIPVDSKGLVEVTRVMGMGATLIKREVFENTNYPWFQEQSAEACGQEYKELGNSRKISYTDDAFFTMLAVKAGYVPKVISDSHAGHVDFQEFAVYGHANIVNNKTGKLRNKKDIKWALSEEYKKELIEDETFGLTPDDIEHLLASA